MKTKDMWDSYSYYTEELTKFSRNLAYANVAICWLFRTGDFTFPTFILLSLVFISVFFFLDVLQFFISALLIKFWTEKQEEIMYRDSGSIDGDIEKPRWLDKPAFLLFISKISCLLIAYCFLLFEFIGRI